MRPCPSARFLRAFDRRRRDLGDWLHHHPQQGYPLYEPQLPARPADRVARLFGPLAKVDDRDVMELGAPFDVEPGCHVLEVRQDFLQVDTAGAARPLEEQRLAFGAMMTAGYIYSVERTSVSTNDTRGGSGSSCARPPPTAPSPTGHRPTRRYATAKCQAMRSVLQKE